MSIMTKSNGLRTLVFTLALFASAGCNAWWAHGGGWGYHGGYYGGGWGYRGAGWGWGAPARYYYAPACETVRVCNAYGHCWLRRACY